MNPPYAKLTPDLNRTPARHHHVHLMGICGTGMASLAGILKQKGHLITGSDENIYPPMSQFLEDLSIQVLKGYHPKNLHPEPDLVIVGNVITGYNPEAVELSRLKIPYLSMPQALRQFAMGDQKSIAVCGTHGKTTTTALVAWILESAGLDPGFMIGGLARNFDTNFKLGKGPFFVIEGDEYDTAFFDKGPKFLHYNPWIAILTSIEFDHADIYRDLDHIIDSFRRLIALIPPDGYLIANEDDPIIMAESKRARCPVLTYGLGDTACLRAGDIFLQEECTRFQVLKQGKDPLELSTSLYGRYNVSNVLAGVALSEAVGIADPLLAKAITSFKGVKRRQEIRGESGGILIVDDFAHHPTAVKETIQAVKDRYKDRRLIAVFEPRSNSSRRNIFQEQYATGFDRADLVFIPEPPLMEKIPPNERFSSAKLVADLNQRGIRAFYSPDTAGLHKHILSQCRTGDVILIMSNGSFDHLVDRLLESIENL